MQLRRSRDVLLYMVYFYVDDRPLYFCSISWSIWLNHITHLMLHGATAIVDATGCGNLCGDGLKRRSYSVNYSGFFCINRFSVNFPLKPHNQQQEQQQQQQHFQSDLNNKLTLGPHQYIACQMSRPGYKRWNRDILRRGLWCPVSTIPLPFFRCRFAVLPL